MKMHQNKIPARKKCSHTHNVLTFVIDQKAAGNAWLAAMGVPQRVLKT
jgi:hypothetical protein